MKTLISLLFIAIIPCVAQTEVPAVTILNGRGEGAPDGVPVNYTVPAGKVLIVESVHYITTGTPPNEVFVQSYLKPANYTPTSVQNSFVNCGEHARYKVFTFEKPIRLTAGERLGAHYTMGYHAWRGLLADTTDRFAKLDIDLGEPRIEGDRLPADAKVQSLRPFRLDVESSVDLVESSVEPSSVVTPGDNYKESTVSVDLDPNTETVIRVAAIARPKAD